MPNRDPATGRFISGEPLMAATVLIQADTQALDDSLAKMPAKVSAAATKAATSTKALDVAMDGVKKSTGNAGRAILEFSRAFEDAQYGIRGVQNNIPGLISALGGGAGLAGAMSLIAVVGSQIYEHWDKITGLFGQGHTKTEAERMQELADATKHTADATKRLNEYKELQATIEAQQTGKTKSIQEMGSAVRQAIIEADPDTIAQGIADIEGERLTKDDADSIALRKKIAERQKENAIETSIVALGPAGSLATKTRQRTPEEIAAIEASDPDLIAARKALTDRTKGLAKQLLAKAETSPGVLTNVINSITDNPGKFGAGAKGLLASLTAATPAATQQAKADAEEARIIKENEDEDHSIRMAQEDARKDAKAAAKKADEGRLDALRDQLHGASDAVEARREALSKIHMPQLHSIQGYLDKLQAAAFDKTEDKILKEAVEQKKLLEKVVENTAKQFKATYQ